MNIAIVGNRAVDLSHARPIVESYLSQVLPISPKVLVRSRRSGLAPFESMVASIAKGLKIEVVLCKPDPRGGREGTYVRDAHMAQMADQVLAFFAPHTLMAGGTGHVVEKAIDKERPVVAYEIDATGLRWVGSID